MARTSVSVRVAVSARASGQVFDPGSRGGRTRGPGLAGASDLLCNPRMAAGPVLTMSRSVAAQA